MILSFLKRIFSSTSSESTRFERDLVSLEGKIKKASRYRESLKIAHKRCKLFLVVCYFGLFLGCILRFFICSQEAKVHFKTIGIGILGSLGLFLVWKGFGFWYSKRVASYDSWLGDLKRQQKTKVEEFKVKSGYYQTKSLIERFDKSQEEQEENLSITNPIDNSLVAINPTTTNELVIGNATSNQLATNNSPTNLLPTIYPITNDELPSPQISNPTSPNILTLPRTRGWMDKLVDAVLGEVPEHYKYALICNACAWHNGLCFPEELAMGKRFICTACGHLNEYGSGERIKEKEEEEVHIESVPAVEQHSTLRKRKVRSTSNKRKNNHSTEKCALEDNKVNET